MKLVTTKPLTLARTDLTPYKEGIEDVKNQCVAIYNNAPEDNKPEIEVVDDGAERDQITIKIKPQKRYKITLNTQSGAVVQQTSFSDLSTYRKARSYIRFLHTGEALGLLGQTIAGLSSLFVCLLVYTGLMLSIRRWKNYQKRQSNSKQQLTANSA